MGKDYYRTLGLPRGASAEDVRRAYRRQALRYHPDKNTEPGAEERFKEVAEAYDVLSDPQKREIFDKYGEEGLKGGGAPCGGTGGSTTTTAANGPRFSYTFRGDPRAMFAEFFAGRNPFDAFFAAPDDAEADDGFGVFARPPGAAAAAGGCRRQDPPVLYDLHVSLEEVLSGCTKKLKISRRRLTADGRTVRSEDKILAVEVRPGWKAGTRVTFPGEGDQTPTNVPADVVCVLRDKPHGVFRRDGADLVYPAHISLREALCGCTIQAPTLDGRTIPVAFQEVLRPGAKRRLPGEGLPFPRDPERRGDLVLEFHVRFPERIPPAAKPLLEQILPP
ncbi:dnaJ homolog subfamily B member 1 isoform X1 [Dromaius novaehollandiae]|uniref:dnaJ homolog subfamily B member 1 isoform X1 n=1 Tax=Dromaius novaehollandiae TaxID=8790 RepID=UPI00311EF905